MSLTTLSRAEIR